MNPAPRDLLLHLLAAKSFRLGDFKLSSGASSDYYIDCRTTTLHAEGARLVARVVTDIGGDVEISSGTSARAVTHQAHLF
jgi:orotate phosphoribosyltransferase